MTAEEKLDMLVALESSRRTIAEVLSGVSENLASCKPEAGRWSILECMEHVAVSEDYLFSRISLSTPSAVPLINAARESAILKKGPDRTTRVQSPEVGKPTGRFRSLQEAVRYFFDSRQQTIQFVRNCNQDLRSQRTSHPLIGPVNCYETLLLMVVHPLRHAKQIQEIRDILAIR